MKKSILISAVLVFLMLTAVQSSAVTVAIPNDTTNEARALLLLESLGCIKLKDGAGITATPMDIADDPHGIEFSEVEAAQVPSVLPDVDYAVINSNYALDAKLDPMKDALAIEGSSSAYANILAVRAGRENDPEIRALTAALMSRQVADEIEKRYGGAVVSVVDAPTDGYAPDVDYDAIKGRKITTAASPTPHAEILAVAAEILAARGVTLEVIEFTDYIQPNNVVESGEVDANYFQHLPYLDDFNAQNGTHIVSVAAIHVEPMGIYGGRAKDLGALGK